MQNQILHPAQPTRTPAQLVRRIGTRYTAETASFYRFLGTIDVSLFSYPTENGTIRCGRKFCTQHNPLERQHNSLGESGQYILLKQAHFSDFRELSGFYRSVIELRMVPLDAESNSASSTTH
jgi:hypothetical protein